MLGARCSPHYVRGWTKPIGQLVVGARGFRGFVRAFGERVELTPFLAGGWQLSECPEIASARTIEIVLSLARRATASIRS